MRSTYRERDVSPQLSILTQFFPPDYAPTGQLMAELAQSLSREGFKVQVFAGQPGYAYDCPLALQKELINGVTVRRTRTARLWPRRIRGRAVGGLLYCLRSLVKLIHPARRGDLVLVTTEPPYLPLLAYLLHCLFKQPYLCVVYDLYPDVAVALNVLPHNHGVVRLWQWLNGQTWRHASAIVVLTQTMKQRIVDHCPEAATKISVIHNWADPGLIYPRAKTDNWFARQHHLSEVFTVLYSGNMGRCHDMDTIMTAAQRLRHEPIRFVFIGAGAKRQACLSQANRLGLPNCLFLPYQAKADLPYSLTACDLSLVSLVPGVEGLVAPSKLYSSLAAGRPVAAICEPHSYLRSLLAEGDFGRAFANGDGDGLADFIRTLAADTNRGQRMGYRGRRYMQKNFTPEQITRRYFEVVDTCMRQLNPALGAEPQLPETATSRL
jgi:glycosyltransferase involved in cell wall biosynthesis